MAEVFFNGFLTVDGLTASTASGNAMANIDASAAPVSFFRVAPVGFILRVYSITVQEQVSGGNFRADRYGRTLVLVNGLRMQVQDASGALVEELWNLPVLVNAHFARYAAQIQLSDFGTGNNFLEAPIPLAVDGAPLTLAGSVAGGRRIAIVLNDDFTPLVDHTFFLLGSLERIASSGSG